MDLLDFRAIDFTLFGLEIGRAVTIEIELVPKPHELQLVQPPRLNLDVEPEQNGERAVFMNVDFRTCALDDAPSPCARWRGRRELRDQRKQKQP